MSKPILVVPTLALDTLVRALGTGAAALGSTPFAARFLPVEESQVTVVRTEGEIDLAALVRQLSVGGTPVGLVMAADERWQTWREGVCTEEFGPDDALHIPLDAGGDPDFDAEPRLLSALAGAPGRRVRSALDRGMQALASCRFAPVIHALADPKGERRFLLVSHGHRVEIELSS